MSMRVGVNGGWQTLKPFSLRLLRGGNKCLFFQWHLDEIVDTMHSCTVVELATSPFGKLLLCKTPNQPLRIDLSTASLIMEHLWSYGPVADR